MVNKMEFQINGISIPAMAYGVGTKWFKRKKSANRELNNLLIKAVQTAISPNVRFSHIDCAEVYGNEVEVGIAIKDLQRSSLFLVSKVISNIKDIPKAISQTLEKLQTTYLDLYLIHAPFFDNSTHGIDLREAWREMEKLVDQGLVKAIGVSNFRKEDLEFLLTFANIKPAINQIEFHAYLQSPLLLDYCFENGIVVAGYAPLAPITGKIVGGPLDEVLHGLSEKYLKTRAQILLRWVLQRGVLVVTTTDKEERMKECLSVVDGFELEDGDVQVITDVGSKLEKRLFWVDKFNKN